jgi:hypothetical protein
MTDPLFMIITDIKEGLLIIWEESWIQLETPQDSDMKMEIFTTISARAWQVNHIWAI